MIYSSVAGALWWYKIEMICMNLLAVYHQMYVKKNGAMSFNKLPVYIIACLHEKWAITYLKVR